VANLKKEWWLSKEGFVANLKKDGWLSEEGCLASEKGRVAK
jgi:hypothetical protein